MRDLLGAVLTFISIGVASLIGGAMIVVTSNVTQKIAPSGTALMQTLETSVGDSLTTLTSLLPLLALAIVGGLCLAYVVNFMGFGGGNRGGNV